MSTYTDPDNSGQGDGVQHGQNAVEGQGIDDPGVAKGAPKPLSPEEYAQAKEEINEQGDSNRSGHANG